MLALQKASRFRLIALVATAIMLIAGLSLLDTSAFAASNPSGNNGTVKIHETELDSNPWNQPHVECPFTVAFFGFDTGDVAEVLFTAWPPTDTGKTKTLLTDTVFIGADDNSGGGSSTGFDGEKAYTLDFDGIVAHQQQGYHVKLQVTVTSPGSNTPKFNKYKVFWAQPCVSSSSSSSSSSTTTTTTLRHGGGSSSSSSTTSTTRPGGGNLASSSTTSTRGGGLGGASSTPRGPLPFTGSNALPPLIAALALLALGGGAVAASRRHRKSA